MSTPNLSEWSKSNVSKRMSSLSLFKVNEAFEDDTSESSDNSDHMSTSTTEHDWQVVGVPYSTYESGKKEHKKSNSISLGYHVNQILGSTLDEVDEEIDQDWEDSRRRLRQSLQLNKKIII
jgi:hypothetical protein